jgi:hypothetical protein
MSWTGEQKEPAKTEKKYPINDEMMNKLMQG